MTEQEVLRDRIIEAASESFNENGIKFTMDDIARRLMISKKTIYTVFEDKQQLLLAMVDKVFGSIKEAEEKVLKDSGLATPQKLEKLMSVMPECYQEIDFSKLHDLRFKYPSIYEEVSKRLETGWESTIALMEHGIKEGSIKPVSIPLVKMMLEASLEQFFQRNILEENMISYQDALNQVVAIIMGGITADGR